MAIIRTTPAPDSASGPRIERVRELLARAGIAVDPASLAARDPESVLVTGRATLSWALDDCVLRVYDIAGDAGDLATLLARAGDVASERGCIAIVAEIASIDPAVAVLGAAGFCVEDSEPDVVGGQRCDLLTLGRIVPAR